MLLTTRSSVSKLPVIFIEPVASIIPLIERLPFSTMLIVKLALSSTIIEEDDALSADPLNMIDPLLGVIMISLAYTGTGYKYLTELF